MSGFATVPVVVVSGTNAEAMAASTIALQWDLPSAVVVSHRIDVELQQLHRVVSDVTGVLEREVVDLAHACVSCAIREDIVPTLLRLGSAGRWGAIVAHLPVAAEALQVCRVLALERRPGVAVVGVVAAVSGEVLVESLTGDDLLCELDLHTADDDRRGLAETTGTIVEYADVVSVHGECTDEGLALLRALARPDAVVVHGASELPTEWASGGRRDHAAAEAWVDETRRAPLGELEALGEDSPVWRLDLRSDRPFHPGRLHDLLEVMGSGAHRSRGCFWLPTRPDAACAWDGAGGQVSIGGIGPWTARGGRAHTRLVFTGLTNLTSEAQRAQIRTAFARALLDDRELAERGTVWEAASDGFEPWLGDIRAVA